MANSSYTMEKFSIATFNVHDWRDSMNVDNFDRVLGLVYL